MNFFSAKFCRKWTEGRAPLEYDARILSERYNDERYFLGVLINPEAKCGEYRKTHLIGVGKTLLQLRINSDGHIYANIKPAIYILKEEIMEEHSERVAIGDRIAANYNWKQATPATIINGYTVDNPPFEGQASFILTNSNLSKPKRMQPDRNRIFKALNANEKLFKSVLGEVNYQNFLNLLTVNC